MTKWILYYAVRVDDQEKDERGDVHTLEEWKKLIEMFLSIPCNRFVLEEVRMQR